MIIENANMPDMISKMSGKNSDYPAFVCEENGERTVHTYRCFASDVKNRAAVLKEQGHTCIGIVCRLGYETIVEIFAANLAGLQVVMLSPALSGDQIQNLIMRMDIDCLYGRQGHFDFASGVHDGADRILFFTSGTTSSSRAVVLTGTSLVKAAWNGSWSLPLRRDDILLCLLPLDHVFGFVCGILWGLNCGCTVALGRGRRHLGDDGMFFQPTVVSLVPALFSFWLRRRLFPDSLRQILIGGAACDPALIARAREIGLNVAFGYGLSETSSGAAISVNEDPAAMSVCIADEIMLADDGEILIRSEACMMQGYYRDPVHTAEVLRDGVLHTGDLGSFDDRGRLHIIGRRKEMIVLEDGTKIFLPEYEKMLGDALGDQEAALVMKNNRLVLVYGGSRTKMEVDEILDKVMRDVPYSHRIQDVVMLGHTLPRTANGKVRRYLIMEEL